MATNNAIDNTSNPLASTAVTIDPGASGDSYTQFNINGTGEFRIGVDDTDDSFRISQGNALGTNDTFVISSGGLITRPLQPSFRATPSSTLSNVTGDGTAYTVVFATESFDRNGDYDGTSTFTAPLTGLYYFACSLSFDDLTTSYTQLECQFDRNSGTLHTWLNIDPSIGLSISGDIFTWCGNITLYLTASDTVSVKATASGSTKTVDIITTNNASYFCGYLIG